MNYYLRSIIFLLLISFAFSSKGILPSDAPAINDSIPTREFTGSKKNEFRAVWVATINNIDWPSKSTLTVDEQKSEFLHLLDTFEKFNLNVVILQVRAASDAFYPSKTEPWSLFLTGKQGKAPEPYYDPLAWALEMCHKRGMELHAWFNPFRVRNLGYYPLESNSFASRNPQYVKEFDKKYFLDPGYPEVRTHVVEVISEVARNYDVDAIVLDDYFYPYPVAGKRFGDDKSFARYGQEYYPQRIHEWRRENINTFISSLHDSLKIINPELKFGVSPFGIWRNKSVDIEGSTGRKGLSSYDDLYADVRKWLANEWIDYVIPQLYWEKGNDFGDFTALVKWWGENSYGKPLYIGQALFKTVAEEKGWKQPNELNEQIDLLRKNENVRGFSFFSASCLNELSDCQVKDLRENQLRSSALLSKSTQKEGPDNYSIQPTVADSIKNREQGERIMQEFLFSLDYYPISIRETWKALSQVNPVLKKENNHRILSWYPENRGNSPHLLALVTFKKTGKKRYRQTVLEFSATNSFPISEKKWNELKDMELLLVSRDVNTRVDHYSSFFEFKSSRLKMIKNPFQHF